MKKEKKPLSPINKVVADLIKRNGGNKAGIARKLSENAKKRVSPQLLGQYATGKTPGSYFIIRWEEVYGDRIPDLVRQYNEAQGESKVSHGTKNETKHTHEGEPVVKEKTHSWNEERAILIDSLKQFGETNAYLLKRIKEMGG